MLATNTKKTAGGFTLVEVLIVAAIVGVLLAVAVPSYQNSVRKSNRTEGKSLLLEAAQIQERHFTEFGQYGTTIISSGAPTVSNVLIPTTGENGYYTLAGTTLTATAFTFEVTPTGAQASDSCGKLSLTHTGIKGADGGVDACW